ncbi:hypothetical protein DFH94DRAFT_126948 [Russula ochroleuca]|uniref:Uncharacterized protein n=1 Tax=Russula ochroleuca TaxID=152965 RepID=A0A9P5K203_9AGAM|nr:hypothetical protein DFH94DRAFT_126948 [Russula ochroleuca]
MAGVFVPYCNNFLPSHIRTPLLHSYAHEPGYHLDVVDAPHRAYLSCSLIESRRGLTFIPLRYAVFLVLVTPSVATPRDVGTSDPVHSLSIRPRPVFSVYTQSFLSTHIYQLQPCTHIAMSTEDTTQTTKDGGSGLSGEPRGVGACTVQGCNCPRFVVVNPPSWLAMGRRRGSLWKLVF